MSLKITGDAITGLKTINGSSISLAGGPIGPSGPSGANGGVGAQGPSGPSGPSGGVGLQGLKGDNGASANVLVVDLVYTVPTVSGTAVLITDASFTTTVTPTLSSGSDFTPSITGAGSSLITLVLTPNSTVSSIKNILPKNITFNYVNAVNSVVLGINDITSGMITNANIVYNSTNNSAAGVVSVTNSAIQISIDYSVVANPPVSTVEWLGTSTSIFLMQVVIAL